MLAPGSCCPNWPKWLPFLYQAPQSALEFAVSWIACYQLLSILSPGRIVFAQQNECQLRSPVLSLSTWFCAAKYVFSSIFATQTIGIHGHPWHSMTFHDIPWHSMTHRSMSKGYDSCKATAEGSVTVCEARQPLISLVLDFGQWHLLQFQLHVES